MSEFNIDIPDDFVRGGLIAARTTTSIETLNTGFPACWEAVGSLHRRLASDEAISIVVEIWLDTGRVFWIGKARREVFRLELKCDAVEVEYFRFLKSPDFESHYARLMETMRRAIGLGLTTRPDHVIEIVVRDSDDSATAVTVFKSESIS